LLASVSICKGIGALLAGIRRVLRTQRGVRLAVLYGSVARGDEDESSDLDLLVSLSNERLSAGVDLTTHLRQITARRIDIAYLGRVEDKAPLLLARVLDDGRVLADRDGQWAALRARRQAIRLRARRSHRRQMALAAQAIEELTQ
jgi:predicted nucleotidyltransferase